MPRFATTRTPSLRTDGRAVSVLAGALGTPLLPWQRYVADVAGERLPDGRYRRRIVVLTVPRQSGKTVLLRCVGVHRATVEARRRVFYTAQTGKDARKRWEDMISAVQASPLSSLVKVRLRAGAEALVLPNASEFGVFSPKRDALHGETPHLVMIDEAWKHDPELGDDLMGAIRPAQITLPDRQLWIVSTAGDAQSSWFRGWIDAGRASVSDPDADIAYFDWSAPDDATRDDPQVWRTYHPTYGELVGEDDLRENLTLADFDRAYLNRWPTITGETVLALPIFDAAHDKHQRMPAPGDLSFGIAVGPDDSDATISAYWRDDTGHRRYTVIERRSGAAWLPDRLRELRDNWSPRAIGYDDHGPTVTMADDLIAAGFELTAVTTREYATACASLVGQFTSATASHNDAGPLRDDLEVVGRRNVGDLWVWDRRAGVSITAVESATVARWVHDHAPEKIPDEEMRISY